MYSDLAKSGKTINTNPFTKNKTEKQSNTIFEIERFKQIPPHLILF
jgi:hypothetical protein